MSKNNWNNKYSIEGLPDFLTALECESDAQKLYALFSDLEFWGAVYDAFLQDRALQILRHTIKLLPKEKAEKLELFDSFFVDYGEAIEKTQYEDWMLHQSLFQLAYEDGKDSPVSAEADRLLADGRVNFCWMKELWRPTHYTRSGLQKTIRLKEAMCLNPTEWADEDGKYRQDIDGVLRLRSEQIVSWDEKYFHFWDKEWRYEKKPHAHREQITLAVELCNGDILSFSYNESACLWNANFELLQVIKYDQHKMGDLVKLRSGEWIHFHRKRGVRLLHYNHSTVLHETSDYLEEGMRDFQKSAKLPTGETAQLLNYYIYKGFIIADKEGVATKLIRGHEGDIYEVMALDNGNVLTWGSDGTIRIWDVSKATLLHDRSMVGVGISGMMELGNSEILVWTAGWFGICSADGKFLREFSAGKGVDIDGGCIELQNDRLLFWSAWNSKMFIYCAKTGKLLKKLSGHDRPVSSAIELKNGNIVSWSHSGTLSVINSRGKDIPAQFPNAKIAGAAQLDSGEVLLWDQDSRFHAANAEWKFYLWDKSYNLVDGNHENMDEIHSRSVELKSKETLAWSDENCLFLLFSQDRASKKTYICARSQYYSSGYDREFCTKFRVCKNFILAAFRGKLTKYVLMNGCEEQDIGIDEAIMEKTKPIYVWPVLT